MCTCTWLWVAWPMCRCVVEWLEGVRVIPFSSCHFIIVEWLKCDSSGSLAYPWQLSLSLASSYGACFECSSFPGESILSEWYQLVCLQTDCVSILLFITKQSLHHFHKHLHHFHLPGQLPLIFHWPLAQSMSIDTQYIHTSLISNRPRPFPIWVCRWEGVCAL
jgi:hypothetical protein